MASAAQVSSLLPAVLTAWLCARSESAADRARAQGRDLAHHAQGRARRQLPDGARHHISFACGSHIPLTEVCVRGAAEVM